MVSNEPESMYAMSNPDPKSNNMPTVEELAAQLKADYDAAGRESSAGIDKVTAVLLFAEKNIAFLDKSNYCEVIRLSGLPARAYGAWLSAGMKLARARAKRGLK